MMLALAGALLVARAPRLPLPHASLIAAFICAGALVIAAVGVISIVMALGGTADHRHGAPGALILV